jgi:BirA family biotin operon repressor/biotin-[acetyl-CoA-carboxylase] ligase
MLKSIENLNFIHLVNVDSTNNYVANLFRLNEIKSGTVVSAEYQSNGRGQRTTKWQSGEAQNALFSLFLSWENLPNSFQFIISMLTAISIQEVIEKKINKPVHIKWPNDIYVNELKIAGILIENNLNSTHVTSSVIGVGLNVNQSVFSSDLSATSLLLETGQMHNCQETLSIISKKMIDYFFGTHSVEDAFNKVKTRYLSKIVNLNKPCKIYDNVLGKESIIKPVDIARSGQLIAQDELGSLRFYDVKDIVWNW